jgi:hypothetical protein
MKLIEECDDVMTIEEFSEYVINNWFIDYDGVGEFATKTYKSGIDVYPSTFFNHPEKSNWTHVVWYNR